MSSGYLTTRALLDDLIWHLEKYLGQHLTHDFAMGFAGRTLVELRESFTFQHIKQPEDGDERMPLFRILFECLTTPISLGHVITPAIVQDRAANAVTAIVCWYDVALIDDDEVTEVVRVAKGSAK